MPEIMVQREANEPHVDVYFHLKEIQGELHAQGEKFIEHLALIFLYHEEFPHLYHEWVNVIWKMFRNIPREVHTGRYPKKGDIIECIWGNDSSSMEKFYNEHVLKESIFHYNDIFFQGDIHMGDGKYGEFSKFAHKYVEWLSEQIEVYGGVSLCDIKEKLLSLLKEEKMEKCEKNSLWGSLGDRIKGYEKKYNYKFPSNEPIILRCDGRGFSQWTHSLDKPIDMGFSEIMRETTMRCMKEIQGCVFSYTESDEITFLLYRSKPDSQVFFNGNQSKLISIVSSMVSCTFNALVLHRHVYHPEENGKWLRPLAIFDCRAFELPKDDSPNAIIFRIHDAKRNSILNTARKFHSHKEVENLNCSQMLEKFPDAQSCWNGLNDGDKFGRIYYIKYDENGKGEIIEEEVHSPSSYPQGLYPFLYEKIFSHQENFQENSHEE